MANNPKKYASDNTLSAVVAKIKELFVSKTDFNLSLSNKADKSHTHSISDTTNLQSTLNGKVPTSRTINNKALTANITLSASDVGAAPSTHSHDDKYYTETEMDAKLAGKSDTTHKHDNDYAAKVHSHDEYALGETLNAHTENDDIHFTAAERTKLSGIAAGAQVNTITGVKGNSESSYRTGNVNITKANIGLGNVDNTSDANKPISTAQQLAFDEVNDAIGTHTKDTDIHVTTGNKTNWNAAYTHSTSAHARTDATKVESSSTNGKIKINGTDTTVYSHPNSGATAGTYKSVTVNAQGHVTGGSNPTTLAGYGITDAETKGTASSAVSTHNTSTSAHGDIRTAITELTTKLNNFLDVDDTTTDQLSELLTLIENNATDIESITSGKVNVSDIINNLTTNVTNKPLSAAQGVAIKALIDALDLALDEHDGNTTKHITSTERTNWNTAYTHSQAAHAPSNAQANQNAFSNVKVGSTTIAADTTTDTLTLEGSNVTITPDATNDKVTFSVADGTTSAKGVVQLTNSTSSTSTTTAATPNSVKSAYDLANTAKTNAATAQTRADSAYSLAESKADSLSDLGITATATELNYVDGVTSNVQTQLDNKLPRNMIAYGTCSTAEDIAEKVVTTTNGNFQLVAGAIIHVNFTYANSASFVKLAIDGNEAKSAKKYGSWTLEGGEWKKGQVVKFVYDGYSFYMEGGNTTIEAGGTGADNVEDARENLSVYSKEDHAWTLLYDSGAITGNVNAFSGISVAGYNNIAVAIKCVNTSGNSAARAGSIYISTQTGVKYQFPVLTNLFTTSANTSAGMAIFNRVGDYLVCPYAARNINAPNFLETSLGGTADNLTPIGGGIMRCISPMSSVIVSSLDQNSSYYFGAGSRVMVWGWNA